jgi:putative Ca2+/H+ antiporter (TMEM165/GDT1 family)
MWQRIKSSRKSENVDVENAMPETKHGLGKKFLIIFKLFSKTFVLIFLAEWGDRSQLATIVMVSML